MNVVLVVLVYFIAIISCGILIVQPDLRHALHKRLKQLGQNTISYCRRGLHQLTPAQKTEGAIVKKERWSIMASLHRNRWLISAAGLLALTPIVLVLVLKNVNRLDEFQLDTTDPDNRIANLLRGEQLVPPPPLPPEVFQTAEVEAVRPMTASASRNWQQLDSDFEQRLLLVFKIMEEKHGIKMVLLEGYRSPERQNMLAKMGGHVTNAKAFQSYHQFGLAADCAFMRNGKVVISEKDPWAMNAYNLYGEAAESVGMVWGGRWKMMDFGHVELRKPNTIGRAPKQTQPM